jgi:hypothetical protein
MTVDQEYEKIMYQKNLPWLKLDMSFPVAEIWKEIEKIEGYNDQSNSGWKGLAYRGISAEKVRPYTNYGYKSEDETPYKWTEISDQAPLLRSIIQEKFPNVKIYRVKLNRLMPGGKISPHSDSRKSGLGLTEHSPYTDPDPYKIKYLTLALDWPEEVEFYVNKNRLPIKTGDFFLVNFSQKHEVYNTTNQPRTSIIITAELESELFWKELVVNSFNKFGSKALNMKKMTFSRWLKLRLQFLPKRINTAIRKVFNTN